MKLSTLLASTSVLMQRPQALLARTEYLMMISHMRSYSTLLGHILGSHPEIIGHRERHRSYENRFQLLFFRYHMFVDNRRAGRGYVFDKLLHNHCRISDAIIRRPDVHLFAVLRKPESTLKSVLNMGRLKGQTTGFGDPEWVGRYYCERLKQIVKDVARSPRPVMYFDAEDVVERTSELLPALRDWLGLHSDLSTEYKLFDDTGVSGGRGDWAGNIREGTVVKPKGDRYQKIAMPENIVHDARRAYERCRESLLGLCKPLIPIARAPETAVS